MAEPVIVQKRPFNVEVQEGEEYWWCACGRSANQPFCDGSHRGTGLSPVQFNASASELVHFCGCKNSGTKPICDGTHRTL